MSDMKTDAAADARELRSYQDFAKVVELPLLSPELTEQDVAAGCDLARRRGVAAVVVRPSDLDIAERWTGADLVLGAAVDWPHGCSTTAVKQYAARDALRRGAKEITAPMNTGKLISRQFQYLEMEMRQISEACHDVDALLTISLDAPRLTDEHIVVACRIAKRAGADFVSIPDPARIALLREHARDRVQLKLRDCDTLESALAAYAAGCARVESRHADQLLEAWKARVQ